MLFNSLEFCIFLPIVFVLYWFVFNSNLKIQNLFLIVASYIFYGWWDWRFLFLIVLSSSFDFTVGLLLDRSEDQKRRKLLVLASILLNIGLLGFFKYYNFFVDSFVEAFTFFGYSLDPSRLNIVLPVGISFYTFQTMSYTFDVNRKKIKSTRDIIAFFAFVSFFPQLVAGPIERAARFLPQFQKFRSFNQGKAVDGLRQMLWGFFKKIVIADNCAIYVNDVFANTESYNASSLHIAAVIFSIQLYCDFSGYSDIAIGTGRLFGFNLSKNFDFALFARSPAEFWRKWHISLTSWFREYLLQPLGGYRGGTWFKCRNTIIVFTIIGLWHGANWTFVIFGFINALYIIPDLIFPKLRKYSKGKIANGALIPGLRTLFFLILTFYLITISTIFFRADTLSHALTYFQGLVSIDIFSLPQQVNGAFKSVIIYMLILLFLIIEWVQRNKEHALCLTGLKLPGYIRWGIYYFFMIVIILYGGDQQEFVYFQF